MGTFQNKVDVFLNNSWMASTILDATSGFKFNESLPLAGKLEVPLTVALLLISCLLLSRWARGRESVLRLRSFSIAYNSFMIAASFACCLVAVLGFADRFRLRGAFGVFCERDESGMEGLLGVAGYFYLLLKYLEFSDTVLLALRKKYLSWLHLYHHSAIVVVTWSWLRSGVILLDWMVAINSAVHVVMYDYYLVADLGKRPTWKRALTIGQIIQLCSAFFVAAGWFWFHLFAGCGGIQSGQVAFGIIADTILIGFFINYYRHTYSVPRDAQKKAA